MAPFAARVMRLARLAIDTAPFLAILPHSELLNSCKSDSWKLTCQWWAREAFSQS